MASKLVSITTIPTRSDSDTVASYNVYTDKPSANTLVGTLTPAEALAGKVLVFADGLNHNATAKTVWNTAGESTTNVSNIVVVDLTAIYDPSNESGIIIALLSDASLPTDVSGNGNDVLTVAGHTDPSNSGGLNAFDGINGTGDLTTLNAGTGSTDVIYISDGNTTPFTEIFKLVLDELTISSTYYVKVSFSNNSSFALRSDNNLQIAAGNFSDSSLLASTYFSVGIPRIVTVIRDGVGDVTVQFDDDTPIALTVTAATLRHYVRDFGGNKTLADRELACKIGRYIAFNEEKTGTDLANAKQWVADGTP